MIRFILAGVLIVLFNMAVGIPQGSRPVMAASGSLGDGQLVPRMVEYARASGTPTGPKAPGGAYCFAPVDARGEVDFSAARSYGSVTRPIKLEAVTLKSAVAATRHYLAGRPKTAGVHLTPDANASTSVFFQRPMTAEEFCAVAQTQFQAKPKGRQYAWNLW